MKLMNRIRSQLLTTLLSLWIVVQFISCSNGSRVHMQTGENNQFPLIGITHPFGPDVVIQAVSEDIGSIGFKAGGEVIWLEGEPDRTQPGDGSFLYVWEAGEEGDRVQMKVVENGDEIDFQLKLIAGDGQKAADQWFINFRAADGEYFTGVFERVVDGNQENSWKKGIETAMDLRGQRVEMKVKPTVSAYAPFYLSSNNYGFYVEGTWPGTFDFCNGSPDFVQIAFEGPLLEYKVYLGPSPKQIVMSHALETGPSYIPPRWAFGPWRWRDDHYNHPAYFDGSAVSAPYNSDVVEDILMMNAYDIPCTAYWIDRPWGTGAFGFNDYLINEEQLPNFGEMISWLNEKGIELMLWICPWVMGDMADVALERGYTLVGGEMGALPAAVTDEKVIARFMEFRRQMEGLGVMDFTNQEACEWWGRNGPARLAKMGVKGFKLDRGDGERVLDSLHLITASGITYRENYNDYGRQFAKATYDAVKPVLGEDFILFPRVQYTGSSRYGAMWAGDTDNSAEGLRSALIAMQRCAVMGYPVWGSDTGGYPKHLDREVTMRWLGFSCFSPIMEVGPTNNYGFWGMDSEPSYDMDLMAVWRFYAKLRMSLADYLHGLATIASETGLPVARPLFLEYPEQAESWKDWKTYMLGDDLLVSVVWEKGKTSQQVYLPAGESWINLWNNQEFQGGRYIEVEAPLHRTPVFLRAGSDLVLPDFKTLFEESVEITSVIYRMSDLEARESWK